MSSPQTRTDLLASTAEPQTHQLDRRADEIAARNPGDPDDLLSTKETAAWLGVSVQFLEIGRSRGYGPKFVRLSPQVIKYRRKNILAWLDERLHQSTAEYSK